MVLGELSWQGTPKMQSSDDPGSQPVDSLLGCLLTRPWPDLCMPRGSAAEGANSREESKLSWLHGKTKVEILSIRRDLRHPGYTKNVF